MKAGPTKATLDAVERVIAIGEELTAAEVAERAGMSTRHAREILALLIKEERAWTKRGEIEGGIEVSLYGRPYVQRVTSRVTRLERELAATKRELELVRAVRRRRRELPSDGHQVTARLKPETFERIRALAIRDDVSIAGKVRELLDRRGHR